MRFKYVLYYVLIYVGFFSSKQNEIVTDTEAGKVQAKTDRDITAVQSLLAMSQWSPPSPEHSISPTNDSLFPMLDPIAPHNIQLSPDKVRNVLSVSFKLE